MQKVAVIGGGPAGIAASLNLQAAKFDVTLFTRAKEPRAVDKDVLQTKCTLVNREGEELISDLITTVEYNPDNPDDAFALLGGVDFVLLATPVYAYVRVASMIKPHIAANKPLYVGTIYGQGFFSSIVKGNGGIFSDMPHVDTFSIAYIPWIVKLMDDYTVKASSVEHFNLLHTTSRQMDEVYYFISQLNNLHEQHPVLEVTETEAEVALTADNWFLHTPRLYDLIAIQNDLTNKPLVMPTFYGEYSSIAISLLKRVEQEFEYMKNQLRAYYRDRGIDPKHLRTFREMEELPDVDGNFEPFEGYLPYFAANTTDGFRMSHNKIPGKGWEVDLTHRMFPDDVVNGLAIIRRLCSFFGTPYSTIDSLYKSLLKEMQSHPMYNNIEDFALTDWDRIPVFELLCGDRDLCLT